MGNIHIYISLWLSLRVQNIASITTFYLRSMGSAFFNNSYVIQRGSARQSTIFWRNLKTSIAFKGKKNAEGKKKTETHDG